MERKRSLFIGNGPHNFEPWSSDEETTAELAFLSPNFHTTTTPGVRDQSHLTTTTSNISYYTVPTGEGMPKGTELTKERFPAINRSLWKQPLPRPD
ncbi:hypothetical protein TNCV_1369881 [Trichonephila clavipes]|nr:hypothetical protein TNCV_1369881 [Trichonephila clavipes]